MRISVIPGHNTGIAMIMAMMIKEGKPRDTVRRAFQRLLQQPGGESGVIPHQFNRLPKAQETAQAASDFILRSNHQGGLSA